MATDCLFVPRNSLSGAAEASVDIGEVVQGTGFTGDVPKTTVQRERPATVVECGSMIFGVPTGETEFAQCFGFSGLVAQRPIAGECLFGGLACFGVPAKIGADTGNAHQDCSRSGRIIRSSADVERPFEHGLLLAAAAEVLQHECLHEEHVAESRRVLVRDGGEQAERTLVQVERLVVSADTLRGFGCAHERFGSDCAD
jgi:hypothetical protein